jgi:hypothetical protein
MISGAARGLLGRVSDAEAIASGWVFEKKLAAETLAVVASAWLICRRPIAVRMN